jgi:hypothetical protein
LFCLWPETPKTGYGVELKLQITEANRKVILTWPQGVLQQANQVTGPYNDVGLTSPATNPPAGFYRARVAVP